MIEIKRPISVPVVCTLMAMCLQGCGNLSMDGDQYSRGPICDAIVSGNVDRAIQLVKQGGDVNAGSGCALFAAAQRGQLELVKLLLEHKADPNRRIAGDLTVVMGASSPLMAAVVSRKVQMVQMLLAGGADPRDDFGAFGVVLNFNDVEMAGLILRHGANANMAYPAHRPAYAYVGPQNDQKQVEIPRRDLEPDRIDRTVKSHQCSIDEATR